VGPFTFDDGTHGTYNVSRPDAVQAINGSHPALTFTGVDTSNGVAGIWFAGFFPEGTKPGKIFVTTVPIETIYPDSGRSQFMKGILDFFASESGVTPSNATSNCKFSLGSNFPNPFNSETHIAFSLPSPGNARLTIYNALGQIVDHPVENAAYGAGRHEIVWRTDNLPSGIYFYRLEAAGHSTVRKMALIK
ncbi:MAG: T9SS type A sorting domain-containing protein, partial [Candidatus Neomarinimicrobiota bacterium]